MHGHEKQSVPDLSREEQVSLQASQDSAPKIPCNTEVLQCRQFLAAVVIYTSGVYLSRVMGARWFWPVPPFGPRWTVLITASKDTRSVMSILQLYGSASLAGSRFTTATFRPSNCKYCCMPLQYVVFPLPGGPITNCPKDIAYLDDQLNKTDLPLNPVCKARQSYIPDCFCKVYLFNTWSSLYNETYLIHTVD